MFKNIEDIIKDQSIILIEDPSYDEEEEEEEAEEEYGTLIPKELFYEHFSHALEYNKKKKKTWVSMYFELHEDDPCILILKNDRAKKNFNGRLEDPNIQKLKEEDEFIVFEEDIVHEQWLAEKREISNCLDIEMLRYDKDWIQNIEKQDQINEDREEETDDESDSEYDESYSEYNEDKVKHFELIKILDKLNERAERMISSRT